MRACVTAWVAAEATRTSVNTHTGGSGTGAGLQSEGGTGAPTKIVTRHTPTNAEKSPSSSTNAFAECNTLAEMVCATSDATVARMTRNYAVLSRQRIRDVTTSRKSIPRVLFPQCVEDEGGDLQPLPVAKINATSCGFDDRTYFALKTRPEPVAMR